MSIAPFKNAFCSRKPFSRTPSAPPPYTPTPYTPTPGILAGPREAVECFSVEDLFAKRPARALVNPWLNRWVVLCKDGAGRVGLRVNSFNKGVFVALVSAGSPAAMAGLRFGDQLLSLGRVQLTGKEADWVHGRLRCGPRNDIVMAVRDRPLCRSMVLHKDKAGRLGFIVKNGAIDSIALDTSASRNGLLTNHNLVEINGTNVVGLSDKDMRNIIEHSGETVALTIIPTEMFRALVRGMSAWLVKNRMDHSPSK